MGNFHGNNAEHERKIRDRSFVTEMDKWDENDVYNWLTACLRGEFATLANPFKNDHINGLDIPKLDDGDLEKYVKNKKYLIKALL